MPRSYPAFPDKVDIPARTEVERARTVIRNGETRISISDSTSAARRRDHWSLQGACALPKGLPEPAHLTWTVGWAIAGTTRFHVVATNSLDCGRPGEPVPLPELHGHAVQIDVESPSDVTSGFVRVVPA